MGSSSTSPSCLYVFPSCSFVLARHLSSLFIDMMFMKLSTVALLLSPALATGWYQYNFVYDSTTGEFTKINLFSRESDTKVLKKLNARPNSSVQRIRFAGDVANEGGHPNVYAAAELVEQKGS